MFTNNKQTCTTHLTATVANTEGSVGSMVYTEIDNFGPRMHIIREGTAQTRGTQMQFRLERKERASDRLTLKLPDGAVVALKIPLTFSSLRTYVPEYSRGASGTYQSRGGPRLTLTLEGTERWTTWQMTVPDGTTGMFTLGTELQGQGQLTREGQILGTVGWDASFVGTLNLLGSGQQAVAPSATARNFQIDHWLQNASALAPMPMF